MTVSKKQQASVNKYVAAHYDRVNITMPKGRREVIKAHAEAQGESVNGFINRAISETMERDGEGAEHEPV
ncbi:MAG: type II toxin-antitoxin system HicB family antitoxin [Clostridiales bacterium]|nr:type II toxin-antitoxin system HicB family antitoxin [Clostridiales bacterium]